MNSLKIFLPVLFLLSTSLFAAESEEGVYTVGVVPQFEARKLHGIWRPILDSLESETGFRFKLRGATSIPVFETEFLSDSFDFAYMNPYHLVLANQKAGYTPLVRDHGRQLFGVLVVKKDSNIKSPSELDGKKVAFPAPNALGASLQMRQELEDNFGAKVKPSYVKTHDSVYLDVLLGVSEAGGGVQKTLNRQKKKYRDALRVIHRTKKVAPHPFAASSRVPENVREAVIKAFLKIGNSEEGKTLLARIPIKKIGVASMQDYEPLTSMGLERFYVGTN